VCFGRRGKRINQYVNDSRNAAARALLDSLAARERDRLVRQLARLVEAPAANETQR
jgi:hypothetical protein